MKGLSLGETLSHLREREKRFYDLTLPATEIRMNPDGTIKLNGFMQGAKLQDQALTTLANRIGIQGGYLRRCEGDLIDLRAQNVNRWLGKVEPNSSFLVRMDGNECRAVLSDSYVPVSNLELIERFSEYHPDIEDRTLKVNLDLDATGMAAQLYFTDEKRTVTLKELGDLAFGGIQIGNSEVGFHSVELAMFMFRLVCSNGMVIAERAWGFRRTHLSQREHLDILFQESLPQIVENLPMIARKFQGAIRISVENPAEMFDRIFRKFNLTQWQQKLVTETYGRTADSTLFGIINAFTGAANQEGLPWETRRVLQRAGGNLLIEAKVG